VILPPDAFVVELVVPLLLEVVVFDCCATASPIVKEVKINDTAIMVIVAAVEALIFIVFSKLHAI
jgi:hypothetical protein